MSIKLNTQSGGSVALDAPTQTTGSNDITFKLPVADGSANQVLKTDGSGNLSFTADSGGLFSSYAIICDEKSSGTNGGAMSSGTWHTRDLNTEIADADGIVSISNNQFTLQAGTYLIKASAPGYFVQDHMAKLYDVTASADRAFGTSEYTNAAAMNRSIVIARVTISGATTYEIRHKCANTKASNGFGESTGLGVEKYLIVEIYKES